MGNSYRDRIQDGLKKIREVLSYATDSDKTRMNMMIWTSDSVDALLRGDWVEIPPRVSNKPKNKVRS